MRRTNSGYTRGTLTESKLYMYGIHKLFIRGRTYLYWHNLITSQYNLLTQDTVDNENNIIPLQKRHQIDDDRHPH